MQWHSVDKTEGWRWRFALFPFHLDTGANRTWVWWEWYEARDGGYFTEVRLRDDSRHEIPYPRYP